MTTDIILLAHGSGGRMMRELIEKTFLPILRGGYAGLGSDDSAVLPMPDAGEGARLAMTTDSYVVNPIFFPGGNIGDLAINGTVNDLAMSGATPLYITTGFIVEEGFPISDLETIIRTMKDAADKAGVSIVAGDTKVVDRGKADKLFINTAGVGVIPGGIAPSASGLRPGDRIIVSGTMGDHGIAVMSKREGLELGVDILSDCAPLNSLVRAMLGVCPEIHALRDPTRGGLATALNEFASESNVGILITEGAVPVNDAVRGACEILGLDPLYVANEGKLVAAVPPEFADAVLAAMRAHEYGHDAAIIGDVTDANPGKVLMKTFIGGTRIVDMLAGEVLPRIC
ncbi:MAG: hydrogenase expression/formation protein HypE [Nitrospirae bacterium]|nr:hydrogenase expression/formation protein HypE [Nitrospirota bacterium]